VANDLRLAIITDVHYGPAFEAKAGPTALGLLRHALRDIAATGPALLLDLGDRINNDGPDADLGHMRAVAAAFAEVDLEYHHLPGNHDLKYLTLRDNADILAAPVQSRVLRRGGWDLVLWCADPRVHLRGFDVPGADLDWLAATLARATRPTAVFSHVPLGGGSMVGNYYFEGSAARGAGYANLDDVHDVLLACDQVRLAVAGHVHWNSLHTVDGVPFLTVQSLSDVATSSPEPARAWGSLVLQEHQARLEVTGRDPWAVTVPMRSEGRRWLVRPELAGARGSAPRGVELSAVRGAILDLDGVLYAGASALPGAVEFLGMLRASGRRVVAVTNHSGRAPLGVAAALAAMGIVLAPDEIVTSIEAVVAHLRRHSASATVMVVGPPPLRAAIEDAGYRAPVPVAAGSTRSGDADQPGDGVGASEPVADIVVVGYCETLDVEELRRAAEAIAAGAEFVATNPDRWLPRPGGRVPESGPVVAYLKALSGVEPRVVGKPAAMMSALALERLGLAAREVMWVGDSLETDVAAAAAAGAVSVLVLTGITPLAARYRPRPDVVVQDLDELRAVLTNGVAKVVVSAPAAP
jgi:3',5'-cyclic-AMP phosphodiesterase